jgi:hypothetical protein
MLDSCNRMRPLASKLSVNAECAELREFIDEFKKLNSGVHRHTLASLNSFISGISTQDSELSPPQNGGEWPLFMIPVSVTLVKQ